MQKLDLKTPDFTEEHINKIAELFPNCVTETTDGKKLDFDLLKQELSSNIVEGPQERYQLNWPGKRQALLTANRPITKTLRPCPEESVDFEQTENLFIEGDNLDALKLLQETYLGKVKMIYIDPPYNTGKDFIYSDNFTAGTKEYELDSGQRDEEGGRLVSNLESNGRYHSDWLSMLYPRLKLARNLLRDDGVIFISIDDNEVHNLRKICDEVFGEENFISEIIWKKRSTPPNDKKIGAQHEYIIVYCKNSAIDSINLRQRTNEQIERYKNPDNHAKGPWTAGDLMANVKGGRYVESLYFPIENPRTGQKHFPSSNGNWRFNKQKINELIANNEIYFGLNDEGRPKLKRFFCDIKEGITWTTLWDFTPFNTNGSKEMTELLGILSIFENPKPLGLIKEILCAGSNTNDIILDFFAGSATTAHAVMQLNAEDGGNRKFIMVQLPEKCDEKSEAFKAGYCTIAEISKERIRRAGKKIKTELEEKQNEKKGDLFESSDSDAAADLDIGFRVLKVDSSNMADVYYTPDAVNQDLLSQMEDNIKPDRSAMDLLFQVLLDWGVDLTLPITTETVSGNEVFFVDDNSLAACFEKKGDITEDFCRELAGRKPLRVVFRDSGFKDDSAKINVEQIFKLMSPHTEVRTV